LETYRVIFQVYKEKASLPPAPVHDVRKHAIACEHDDIRLKSVQGLCVFGLKVALCKDLPIEGRWSINPCNAFQGLSYGPRR
jgi:hypothetical protein